MAKAITPFALGEIIDSIEQMREQLLTLQRSLEKMELAEHAASEGPRSNWSNRRRDRPLKWIVKGNESDIDRT
jgi:hypothetical protein